MDRTVCTLILLEGIAHLLHAAGWVFCFLGSQASPRWWQIFSVPLAGSAIKQVTPTATVGDEATRLFSTAQVSVTPRFLAVLCSRNIRR
jgi:hypothetical protein